MIRTPSLLVLALSLGFQALSAELRSLPGCEPLTLQGDLSVQMVGGIDKFLDQMTARSLNERAARWHRDFSSVSAYANSVETNRESLRRIIGVTDKRLESAELELLETSAHSALRGRSDSYTVYAVRWPVLDGVHAEGLWLRPTKPCRARIVALGDCDQTPEMIAGLAPGLPPERQFARRLAEQGCEVLVPVLVSRDDRFSGNPALNRFTNQPHREWIYRQAYELGRHVIGYEVQKVQAALDFFEGQTAKDTNSAPVKLGLAGYAEGGLVALYAAALDTRVDAVLVSGYFDSRQNLWAEPLYRNVFGLLREFGDAEIASLVAPRALVIEQSRVPAVACPPTPGPGRSGAAPGAVPQPDYESAGGEFERAHSLLKFKEPILNASWQIIAGIEGGFTGPASDRALVALLNRLGVPIERCTPPGPNPETAPNITFDPDARQERQVRELEDYTQKVFRESESARVDRFWNQIQAKSREEWAAAVAPFRGQLLKEVLGTFGPPTVAANPRARLVLDRPKWVGFEIVLDVYPEVFAWGYLLVPKDLKEGEKRAVIVCQHGLEGVPADVVNEDPQANGYKYYKAFAARLAQKGYVVFAPHNPYRGGDKFRVLQRKANPIGTSLFSIIIAQHGRCLEWLSALPFVDPQRIGFYGLSYGGKTAMRVPSVLTQYALSICSGDFNEWVRKNVATDAPISYMFTGEYEMPEWDLGHTFNYAEMAALIAPRPFMVERGHSDTVGLDEWVAYEYAKVRRLYDLLSIPERTQIEFFNGPHTINASGTFDFLDKHLGGVSRPSP